MLAWPCSWYRQSFQGALFLPLCLELGTAPYRAYSLVSLFSHTPQWRGGACQQAWPHPVTILSFGILTVSTVETTEAEGATVSQERQEKTQSQTTKSVTRRHTNATEVGSEKVTRLLPCNKKEQGRPERNSSCFFQTKLGKALFRSPKITFHRKRNFNIT